MWKKARISTSYASGTGYLEASSPSCGGGMSTLKSCVLCQAISTCKRLVTS